MSVSITVSSKSERIAPVTVSSDSMNATVLVPESGDYKISINAYVKHFCGENTSSCLINSFEKRKRVVHTLAGLEWT